MSSYRIVCAIDIEAESATHAYERLFEELKLPPGFEWESTDEWYDADGNQLSEELVCGARKAVFSTKGPA